MPLSVLPITARSMESGLSHLSCRGDVLDCPNFLYPQLLLLQVDPCLGKSLPCPVTFSSCSPSLSLQGFQAHPAKGVS